MGLPAPAGARERIGSPSRIGAVQRSDQAPTSEMLRSQYRGSGILDRRWDLRYQDWQDWARRYAKILGIARFAAGIVADTVARCPLLIEERDGKGEWGESSEKRLTGIFDAYRNDMHDPIELQRAHAWHYQVAGEMIQVVSDGEQGVDWGIYSARAVEFDRPKKGQALIKLAPNGSVKNRTAFAVPRKQATRFWLPDEEWPALATSPMAASIEDLHRYYALNRYARRTVESRTALSGMVWTPTEAHTTQEAERDDPGAGTSTPGSKLERDYANWAKAGFSDDGNLAELVPFMVHWDKDGGAPVYIKLGEGLDPHGIEYRNEALTDFARGVNLPASLVVGGGTGGDNHWTNWLVDDKFFEFGIAWVLNRMCHQDLTRTFLLPHLNMLGLPADRFRVGYDKGPVIVKPDQSDHALKLYLAGLLNGVKTLEASNFDEADIMGPDELAKVLDLASRGRMEWSGQGAKPGDPPHAVSPPQPGSGGGSAADLGAAPSNTGPAPGTTGPPPGGPPAARAAADPNVALDTLDKVTAQHPSITKVNAVLAKLTQVRRDLGRTLLSNAELAYAEAMRHAGVKIVVRAKRANATIRTPAIRALDAGEPMHAHLAAIGLTEREALDHAFESFGARSQAQIEAARLRRQQIIDNAGFDPSIDGADEQDSSNAAHYLQAALIALAFQRLSAGHPHEPTLGEVSGSIPAGLVLAGLDIAEGSRSVTFADRADEMPTTHEALDFTPLEEAVTGTLADEGVAATTNYQWVHGFYGEPTQPLDEHLALDGFETVLPGGDLTDEADPELANGGTFPEVDFLSPGDHPGCTCEWIEVVSGDETASSAEGG